MLKRIIAAGILSGMMILGGVFGFAADAPAFTDVKDSDWFAADVGYVCENGLMKGVSETRFDPQGTFTRGMLVTVLYRMEQGAKSGELLAEELSESTPHQSAAQTASPRGEARDKTLQSSISNLQSRPGFSDVHPGEWYSDAVYWAASAGIVQGTSAATFSPLTPITREQLAVMLYRCQIGDGISKIEEGSSASGLGIIKPGVPEGDSPNSNLQSSILSQYTDASQISPWAVEAMDWAVQNGILKGETGKLMPKGNATRAQVAAVMKRFCTGEKEAPAADGAIYSRDGKILYRIPQDAKGTFTVKEGTEETAYRCGSGCNELEEVIFPEGVKRIGQETFRDCPKLRSVTYPSTLAEMEYPGMQFIGCDALKELNVAENNPHFAAINGMIIDLDRMQLICVAPGKSGTITVPEGVTWDGLGAFAGCSQIDELVLADTMVSFCGWDLVGLEGLKKIHFGRDFYLADPEPTVTAVGIARYYAAFGRLFRYCTSLTTITVSEENSHFIAHDDCLIDVDRGDLLLVPQGKKGVLTLPEGIGKVGEFAFYQCSGLTEIRFPEGMKSISSLNGYEGCTGVKKVFLPVGIEYIYDSLEHMPNLKTIEFGGTKDQWAEVLEYYYNRQTVEKLSGVEVLYLGE